MSEPTEVGGESIESIVNYKFIPATISQINNGRLEPDRMHTFTVDAGELEKLSPRRIGVTCQNSDRSHKLTSLVARVILDIPSTTTTQRPSHRIISQVNPTSETSQNQPDYKYVWILF